MMIRYVHIISSFTFLENLYSKNISDMFTKSIFNVCELPFVSKYVLQYCSKLRMSDEKVQRPPKIFLLLFKQSNHSSQD